VNLQPVIFDDRARPDAIHHVDLGRKLAGQSAQDCTIAAIHAKIYQFATHRGAHPAAALWHAVRQALLRDAEAALPPE
jgi:hypothetical protein